MPATVPGAIASVGAVPVFVGVTEGLTIDLDDLVKKDPKADVIAVLVGHKEFRSEVNKEYLRSAKAMDFCGILT